MNAETELLSFFEHNEIAYRREKDGYAFVMSERDCKWKTMCRAAGNVVLFYGMYPFCVSDVNGVVNSVNGINAKIINGAFFIQDNVVIMRTGAVLCDIYTAYEEITSALEYGAGYVVRFWQELLLCAGAGLL